MGFFDRIFSSFSNISISSEKAQELVVKTEAYEWKLFGYIQSLTSLEKSDSESEMVKKFHPLVEHLGKSLLTVSEKVHALNESVVTSMLNKKHLSELNEAIQEADRVMKTDLDALVSGSPEIAELLKKDVVEIDGHYLVINDIKDALKEQFVVET